MAVIKKIEVETFPKLDAWSYSRWSTYMECPRKAMFMYVKKLPQPDSPALKRGAEIHEKLEHYLRGLVPNVPKEAEKLLTMYRALKAKKPLVELEIALTRAWTLTDWFAKGSITTAAWCRIKIDAFFKGTRRKPKMSLGASIIDHKTGGIDKAGKLKPLEKEKHEPQMELYAVGGFIKFPDVDQISTELYHVDSGDITPTPRLYKREELPELIKLWEDRTGKMMSDELYTPNPGMACRFCPYRKAVDGPCVY